MIKVNSLSYPTCPYCGTELNDLSLIPLSSVWFGHAATITCPGAYGKEKCGKRIAIVPDVAVSFKTYKTQQKEDKCETPPTK